MLYNTPLKYRSNKTTWQTESQKIFKKTYIVFFYTFIFPNHTNCKKLRLESPINFQPYKTPHKNKHLPKNPLFPKPIFPIRD